MTRLALVLLWFLMPGELPGMAGVTLHVDAAAGPGGTGTKKAPYTRITDALDAGRAVAGTHQVRIAVAPGDYAAEPRPLVLDYPVKVIGATELARDADGLATGAVTNATTVWGVDANQAMFIVTGDGVTIRGLRLEADGTTPDSVAVVVDKSSDFSIDDIHVSGFVQGIVVSASAGRVTGSFLGPPLGSGIVVGGGNLEHPTDVRLLRNRLVDYSSGGIQLTAADPIIDVEPFDTITAKIDGNVLSTSRPITGPSNPFGLRFSPIFSALSIVDTGVIDAKVTGNVFSGNHRYPLIVNAGQIVRDGRLYTAEARLSFKDNLWLAGTDTVSRIFITFTNSRMGLPPFWNELATSSQYVQASRYELRHDGELDSCLLMDPGSSDCRIDHPEIEPCDGRVLGNVLEIRGPHREILPYGTFIPDVCP